MSIKGILFAGAALCAISMAPAVAATAPHVHLLAAHQGGHAVFKSSPTSSRVSHLTSSGTIYSSVSTSADYKVKTPLIYTYYTYYDSGSFCGGQNGKTKVKLSTKKTAYAKLSTGTESYSEGCGTPTTFYGDVYDLKSKTSVGDVDNFVSTLEGKKIHYNGGLYDIDVNFNLYVFIES